MGRGSMRDYFRSRSTMQLPSTEYNIRPRNKTSVHGRQLPSTSASLRYRIHCFQHEWTKNQINFWNRLTFPNKIRTLFRSLREPFDGKSVKISDWRTFSLLETMLAYRAFSHSVKEKNKSRGGRKLDKLSKRKWPVTQDSSLFVLFTLQYFIDLSPLKVNLTSKYWYRT